MLRSHLILTTLFVVCFAGCGHSRCVGSRLQNQLAEEHFSDTCLAGLQSNQPQHIIKNFAGKVYAIGDLHGDLAQTYRALMLAGAIDADHRWVGKCIIVVQTGDQIDRADEDKEILDELDRLAKEAPLHGSRLVVLNGNHELMNTQLDLRYTTKGANVKFKESNLALRDATVLSRPVYFDQPPYHETIADLLHNSELEHFGFRASTFAPGQNYAKLLSHRSFYAIVNDSVFVHGGIAPAHIQYGLEKFNHALLDFFESGHIPPMTLTGDNGPFWMRDYSMPPDSPVSTSTCSRAAAALKQLGVKRMVVGHTVQSHINSACDGTIWRIDIGMSRAYGGRPPQVLEIDGEKVRVRSSP